jgi:hypothetical protein
MGFQSRPKRKAAHHGFVKPLREKSRHKDHISKRQKLEEKHVATAQEVTEVTLKRLHTLGGQKFGSSPFSEHFDRWLVSVEAVLFDFEANPNIGADEQFQGAREQILLTIKGQLEKRRQEEATLAIEYENLQNSNRLLEQIKTEQINSLKELRARKKDELKQLYSSINLLKKNQNEVIRMKTGLFRGMSRKEQDQKEMEIAQSLSSKQTQLELAMLSFREAQRKLQDEFEKKRAPVFERIKAFQKKINEMETDGSLEERWFACEALADALNTFLQRRKLQGEKRE